MRRNHCRLRCIRFPNFVENVCCNPCCRDTGVQAVRVEAAAENTCGCCCCCGCNCGCNCGNVAGASNCGCGNVAGAEDRPCRPRPPVWGDVGGVGDFSPFPCPCRDIPQIVERT